MDFTDTKAVVIQVRQIREKAEKDLEDVLLPHQAERFDATSQSFTATASESRQTHHL